MKKVLTSIVIGLAALTAIPAQAQHWDNRRGVDHGGLQHPGSYREVQWQRHIHNHHRHGGLNSTEKVIIGAIIGGVVVDAIHRNRPAPEPVVVYAPPLPPQPYPAPAQTCTTREVFDRYGRLISTERTCY